ncbi:MAG: GDSL-type esterase/lipase family protein [Burkholderiaceae bacterium]
MAAGKLLPRGALAARGALRRLFPLRRSGPSRLARKLMLLAGIGVAAWSGYQAAAIAAAVGAARSQIRETAPFNAFGRGARLLVIGDSTGVGVGTGAGEGAASVAGRLRELNPELLVENHSREGSRIRDVGVQVDASEHARYDAVLVFVGGNDVLQLTPGEDFEAHAHEVLNRLASRADLVVLVPPGNVGLSPPLAWPLDRWMSKRARWVNETLQRVAAQHGAQCVELFRESGEDPFEDDPARYFSDDGFHPSADGYELWTAEILRQSSLASVVFR